MLISSKNAFSETCRIMFHPISGYHGLAKLAQIINYHNFQDPIGDQQIEISHTESYSQLYSLINGGPALLP